MQTNNEVKKIGFLDINTGIALGAIVGASSWLFLDVNPFAVMLAGGLIGSVAECMRD